MSEEQLSAAGNPVRENVATVVAVGTAAMLAGAILWALVTVMTHMKLGLMAIVLGLIIGLAIRKFRKRPNKRFGLLGASLALIGCALGNALSLVAFAAQHNGMPLASAFLNINIAALTSAMVGNMDVMDPIFYAIAIYEGYKFSSR